MTRFAAALVAAFVCVGPAAAEDFAAWREGAAAAEIDGDPWLANPGFVAEDAFVFADVASRPALDADALAIAVRIDMDRLARAHGDRPTTGVGPRNRVAAAFERFVSVGADGRAYASLEAAGGRSGPTTTVREVALVPAVLAMSLPSR